MYFALKCFIFMHKITHWHSSAFELFRARILSFQSQIQHPGHSCTSAHDAIYVFHWLVSASNVTHLCPCVTNTTCLLLVNALICYIFCCTGSPCPLCVPKIMCSKYEWTNNGKMCAPYVYTNGLFISCAEFRDPVQGSISFPPLSNWVNPYPYHFPLCYCFVPP